MKLVDDSKEHLRLSEIGYKDHFFHSSKNGFYLIWLGITSIIHAVVPASFNGTAPLGVIKIYFEQLRNHPQPAFQELIRKYDTV